MSKNANALRFALLAIVLIATLLAVTAIAYARSTETQALLLTPPPMTNDYIEYATQITTLPYTFSQPLAATTRSASDPQPSCWTVSFTNTIWYQYTPPVDQRVLFDAVHSDYQTHAKLAVFSGAPGSLAEQGCSAQADAIGVDVTLSAGQTYYIMGAKDGSTPAISEQFTLNATIVFLLPNDDFANATNITTLPFDIQQDIYAATSSVSDPHIVCPGPAFTYGSNSVWFTYTSPVAQTVIVNAKPSSFGGSVSIFTGTEDNLIQQACSLNQINMLPTPFTAQAGATYYIMISEFDSAPLRIPGYLRLNVSAVPLVTNDDFANATEVSGLPFEDRVDVYGATGAPTDPTVLSYCLYSPKFSYPNTIWYRYTAAANQSLNIAAESSPSYRKLIVMYTLQSGNLTQFACSGTDFLSTQIQTGVTYYVMIASEQDYDGTGTPPLDRSTPLHVRFDTPPVPNDLIQDATVVNSFPFVVEQNIYGSTLSPDDPDGCTMNFQSNSVWFRYTPAQNQGVILDATTSDYQTAVKIYTQGAGNTLVEQGCSLGSLGLQVQTGVTYIIMVSRLESGQPALLPTDKLRLHISTPIVANDLLENAITIPAVPYSNTQDVFGATITTNDPKATTIDCISHIDHDVNRVNTVWYQYSASVTQTLLIDTRDSDYQTFVELPDLGICGYGSRTFHAQAGTTYRIKVAYVNFAPSPMPLPQSTLLRFILRPTIANDVQADAISINTIPFTYTENVTDATVDAGEPSNYDCGNRSQSVWFKYVPTTNRTVLIDTSGSNYNTVIALYSGSTAFGCAPISTDPQQSIITLNAQAGYTYYIAIMNHSQTPAPAPIFHLSVTDTTNSHLFDNARVIPTTALTYQDVQDLGNAKNNFEAPYIICGSEPWSGYQNTMWYHYTPALDMSVTVSNLVTQGEIITNVYTADNLQLVGCDHGWNFHPALVNFIARAGKSYYILIGEDTHLVSGMLPGSIN